MMKADFFEVPLFQSDPPSFKEGGWRELRDGYRMSY
jgi:hypothetical protein